MNTLARSAPTKPRNRNTKTISDVIADVNQLIQADGHSLITVIRDVLRTIMQLPAATAVSYFERDEALGFKPATPLICRKQAAHLAEDWEPLLTRLVMEVGSTGKAHGQLVANGAYEVAAAAVGCGEQPRGILVVFASTNQSESLNELFVELIAEKLNSVDGENSGTYRHSAIADFVLTLKPQEDESAFQRLANEISAAAGSEIAFVGTRCGSDHRARLRAVSGNRAFRRPSEMVNVVDDLLAESVLRDQTRLATPNSPDATAAETAFFNEFKASRCVLIPALTACGTRQGAVVLADRSATTPPEAVRRFAEEQKQAIGAALAMTCKCQPSLSRRAWARLSQITARRTFLPLCVFLTLAMMVPLPAKIGCDIELRPVQRRYVAAPHEGLLQDVHVKPGDIVRAGDVLATMDHREVDLQLASLQAEHVRARKRRDTSLAAQDRAETQISKLEMERLEAQIGLLKSRAANLEIRAPIDGIVLDGDPKELEGARITIGQNLFETGPVDRMLAEVWIDGRDVANVRIGQRVKITLDALPYRGLEGEIMRVAPRAEIRDHRTVFIGTVQLTNDDGMLRPGMAGRAKVRIGKAPLFWQLFRKPLATASRYVWF